MTRETRTVVVEVIDLTEMDELGAPGEVTEFDDWDEWDAPRGSSRLSEADSAVRTAALVAPAPPDPDYFVG